MSIHLESKHTEFVDEYVLKRQQVNEMRMKEREKIKINKAKIKAQDNEFKKRKEKNICIDEALEEYNQTGRDKDIKEETNNHVDTFKEHEILGGIKNTNKEDKIRDENNWSSTSEEENYLDNVTVGKAEDNFSIHKSVFYSHNYFRRVSRDDGREHALCIMCWKLSRTKVFLKITDNNTKGELYFRRRNWFLIPLFQVSEVI